MNRLAAVLLLGAAMVAPRMAHADPDTSDSESDTSQPKLEARPNEVALDLGEVRSRIVDRENVVGVRYENVDADGAWALAIEPRGGFGFRDVAGTQMNVFSLGLDATADRRFRLGRFITLVVGGGASADYLGQHAEVTGSPTATASNALAVGPIVFGGARLRIRDDSWFQLGARGGVALMNVDGSFGPVATIGVTGSWGISF